ncbi:MAG: hypothetical protein ACYSUV_19185 [Planctomycetota bacterium]|jgi:DNA-binding transcriptional regulator YhcF (GntR family)
MGRSREEIFLVKTFLGRRVLTLVELSKQLQCSNRTVVRRLKRHGYYSSYNHRGKFLTIKEVARFDSRGLWVCKGARFSKRGNLKSTVQHFVDSSKQGMTHEELGTLLGLRVHDTLLDLVRERRIERERIGVVFVYCSRKRSVRKKQILRRKEFLKTQERPRPTSRQKIATLLELIKHPKATRQEIVRRCKRGGLAISRKVVDVIFEDFKLDKKRAL